MQTSRVNDLIILWIKKFSSIFLIETEIISGDFQMHQCMFKGDEEKCKMCNQKLIISCVSFRESSFLRIHFRSLIVAYHYLLQEKPDVLVLTGKCTCRKILGWFHMHFLILVNIFLTY